MDAGDAVLFTEINRGSRFSSRLHPNKADPQSSTFFHDLLCDSRGDDKINRVDFFGDVRETRIDFVPVDCLEDRVYWKDVVPAVQEVPENDISKAPGPVCRADDGDRLFIEEFADMILHLFYYDSNHLQLKFGIN